MYVLKNFEVAEEILQYMDYAFKEKNVVLITATMEYVRDILKNPLARNTDLCEHDFRR